MGRAVMSVEIVTWPLHLGVCCKAPACGSCVLVARNPAMLEFRARGTCHIGGGVASTGV